MITKAFKTLGILCVGAGFGAGMALLYAPQSGRRTRRDLLRYGNRTLAHVRDFKEDASSYLSGRVDDVWQSSKRLPHRILKRA